MRNSKKFTWHTATKIPFLYSQKRNCAASVTISTCMCLWAIYVFPGLVRIFSCSRKGKSTLGIYKSLTDNWKWKLGLKPRNFFSGNICLEFLVLCLCSAVSGSGSKTQRLFDLKWKKLLSLEMIFTQPSLEHEWFYSLKDLAHFRSKSLVDFHIYLNT